MRLANDVPTRGVAKVENIVDAVRILSPEAVQQLAERVRTFDFFERSAVWDSMPDRFRLHALATRAAADLLASEIGYPDRDRLIVAALLHDVGKLVLMHAYPGYPDSVHRDARTPEERIQRERRELGVDHAVVGGVLARRWGLPKLIANSIERHHSDEIDGDAALVRLADILAHYAHGAAVSPADMLRVARSAGVGSGELRAVLYALPQASGVGGAASSRRARCRCASATSCACWPRARSTSRSPPISRSRRARCARTCTTCTASSAPSIAPRPC